MGIYLNPGNKGFWESVRSRIYVDKTGLISYTNELINTEEKYICVSRPRRFGKSMALKMLAAYYSRGCDSKELFLGRKIEQAETFSEHLNRYDVIFLNIQQFLIEAKSGKVMQYLEQEVLKELRQEYGAFLKEPDMILAAALRQIYVETGREFIFLIDEWDCIMRERQESEQLQREYLDFLRNLLKDQPYVALAYMTGILPVKKYGRHSALNMFFEYSMTDQKALEEYTGFTEDEVQGLCTQFNMDFEETKRWYDGYQFHKIGHVYNPKSVVEAMLNKDCKSYWTRTETYEALRVYIDMNFDGLKDAIILMLGGGRCKINPAHFTNDMTTFQTKDDVLTLLVHLGYLGYQAEKQEVFIPNEEVRGEFVNAIEVSNWQEVMRSITASEALLEATLNCDVQTVAQGLDSVHMDTTSILRYNDENALSCVISLAYYSARNYYYLKRELPAGKGFADMVFLPRSNNPEKPALIVELKWDNSAKGAISQIKERQYIKGLDNYTGTVFLVGINYNKETKTHECIIETIEH